jgi:hypothetical protein
MYYLHFDTHKFHQQTAGRPSVRLPDYQMTFLFYRPLPDAGL